jgi:spore germination protein YaaH
MKILKRIAFTKKFTLVTLITFIICLPLLWFMMHYMQNTRQSAPSVARKPTHPIVSWKALTQAWIYPGPPACTSANEYKDGRGIDTLKPQYYTLNDSGTLIQLTPETHGCNAYSQENALEVKKYSTHQYVTVSGNTPGMDALITDQAKMVQAVTTLKTFLDTVKFTGVEIDFEGFLQWTPEQYKGYQHFLMQLGNILHQNGYKLMIDGPAVLADAESHYQWRYEDFNTLPVDYLVVMEYDWQYDLGSGTPVAPLARMQEVTREVIGKITESNKIVIGIPSYGYHGQLGGDTITIDTNAQSQTSSGYPTAKRDDSSGEMMFTSGGVFYDYADSQTLNTKRSLIEDLGIQNISVWHLGGNQWFSGKAEPHP